MWRRLFGIGDLDGAEFARLVAKTGVEMGRFTHPKVDEQQMLIVDGTERLFLQNIYATFLEHPKRSRRAYIRQVVLARNPEIPATWARARKKLLPVVRSGAYLAIFPLEVVRAGLAYRAADTNIAYRELAPGLFETLVIDAPTRMSTVMTDALARWNVTFDEAREQAHANLRRAGTGSFDQLAPGLWLGALSDSYMASRIVLPEVLQRVCTNPLIAVPGRDLMFVADRSAPHALENLVAVLQKAAADDNRYRITSRIYQLDEKMLRLYEPPAGHSKALDYEKLVVEELAAWYAQEEELHQQIATHAFYSKLLLSLTLEGDVMTHAVWIKGVREGLLPPAKMVAFTELDDAGTPLRIWEAPWHIVDESGLLTPTNAPLPRWKTGTYPSLAWLEANAKQVNRTAQLG